MSGDGEGFRSGLVGIIGRPNVGKSTLLNAVLGRKVAIVTHRPQTTRNRIVGVRTDDDSQIVFLDTPGIHEARKSLNRVMVETALATLDESDVLLYMVDAAEAAGRSQPVSKGNIAVLERLAAAAKPTLLLLNKIDRLRKDKLLPLIQEFSSRADFLSVIPTSALNGNGLDIVLGEVKKHLPDSTRYYPDDVLTDRSLDFIITEFVREQALLATKEEVPYSVAVSVELVEEREGKPMLYIAACIHVERKSQKGILIGKQGAMIKRIGQAARKELEAYLSKRVYLELRVRIEKDWTRSMKGLKRVGFDT